MISPISPIKKIGSLKKSYSNSKQPIAPIWKVVFHLPIQDTATEFLRPNEAIHSRKAEIVISRQIMMIVHSVMMTESGFATAITISATATINLSATGSRNAPKDEEIFIFRAKYPSSQSVIPAIVKRTQSMMFVNGTPKYACFIFIIEINTNIGMMKILNRVSKFGRFIAVSLVFGLVHYRDFYY